MQQARRAVHATGEQCQGLRLCVSLVNQVGRVHTWSVTAADDDSNNDADAAQHRVCVCDCDPAQTDCLAGGASRRE